MKNPLITVLSLTLLIAGPLRAETPVKQIALNASTVVYGTINTGGLGAAVKEIRTLLRRGQDPRPLPVLPVDGHPGQAL